MKLVASPGFSFFHIQSLILDSGELFVPHDHLVLQLPFIKDRLYAGCSAGRSTRLQPFVLTASL